jgi:hypothetical protein
MTRYWNLTLSSYHLDTQSAQEIRESFSKHIAFIGRGSVGATLSELQKLKYWKLDDMTSQPYIDFGSLDVKRMRHNAWIQNTLEANWEYILGQSFNGREETDRAKLGVYALMDWIIKSGTFTRKALLAQTARAPVIISSSKPLRQQVVRKLIAVLIGHEYLKQVEDEYDLIWGRDVTELDVQRRASHASNATLKDKKTILESRLGRLLRDYEAASHQVTDALSYTDRERIKRQLEELDQEINQVRDHLQSL